MSIQAADGRGPAFGSICCGRDAPPQPGQLRDCSTDVNTSASKNLQCSQIFYVLLSVSQATTKEPSSVAWTVDTVPLSLSLA